MPCNTKKRKFIKIYKTSNYLNSTKIHYNKVQSSQEKQALKSKFPTLKSI